MEAFDWNMQAVRRPHVVVHDETLRDGVQSPSVVDPPIETKLHVLHLLEAAGVDSVNLGLPGAGPRARADVTRLAREIAGSRWRLGPACAGRTVEADIVPIIEASQAAGIPIRGMLFIGSSPIRRYVEGWSVELIRRRSVEAIDLAVREGLPVTYVTEDTTRTPPDVLHELFRAAIEHGADSICLCDTVGHATPEGAANLVRFARSVVDSAGGARLEWHGHEDRGLALANALCAIDAGVDVVHGTVLGVGERVGNTSLERLIENLALRGEIGARSLRSLPELRRVVAEHLLPSPQRHGSSEPSR